VIAANFLVVRPSLSPRDDDEPCVDLKIIRSCYCLALVERKHLKYLNRLLSTRISFLKDSRMSDYLLCGVVELRGVHDANGTACGRSARTLCYDCGTSLCPAHAERCAFCTEAFCQSCLSFHRSEHSKPAQQDFGNERKTA